MIKKPIKRPSTKKSKKLKKKVDAPIQIQGDENKDASYIAESEIMLSEPGYADNYDDSFESEEEESETENSQPTPVGAVAKPPGEFPSADKKETKSKSEEESK